MLFVDELWNIIENEVAAQGLSIEPANKQAICTGLCLDEAAQRLEGEPERRDEGKMNIIRLVHRAAQIARSHNDRSLLDRHFHKAKIGLCPGLWPFC